MASDGFLVLINVSRQNSNTMGFATDMKWSYICNASPYHTEIFLIFLNFSFRFYILTNIDITRLQVTQYYNQKESFLILIFFLKNYKNVRIVESIDLIYSATFANCNFVTLVLQLYTYAYNFDHKNIY